MRSTPKNGRPTRTDVITAGTADQQATALYDVWHDTRCRSLDDLAAMQCLVLASFAAGSLERAAADLGALDGGTSVKLRWATLIGLLVQCVWDGAPQDEHEDREVVTRIARAWEAAALSEPPIWASEFANMPRLSKLNPALPLEPSFKALSAPAQLIALETAAWGGRTAVLGSWTLIAAGNNLTVAEAKRAVAELEAVGWAVCDAAAGVAPVASFSNGVAVRVSDRALLR